MTHHLPAALRLLKAQPGLSQSEVARCLGLPREVAREALQAGERAGHLTVTFGPLCPVWHTRPRCYRLALPWLSPSLRRMFSAVLSFPGLPVARLARVIERPVTSTKRLLVELGQLGLVVGCVIQGRRVCLPAPWVLA